jgi:hypothetical protein
VDVSIELYMSCLQPPAAVSRQILTCRVNLGKLQLTGSTLASVAVLRVAFLGLHPTWGGNDISPLERSASKLLWIRKFLRKFLEKWLMALTLTGASLRVGDY